MGKKNKKEVKMSLFEFNGPLPDVVNVAVDWNELLAAEEDEPTIIQVDRSNLPKAPKGPVEIPLEQIPTDPPFIAFLSSLPFSATEDKIMAFFSDCKVVKLNLLSEDGRNRGNGTIEFADRLSLINGLKKNECDLLNRPIKVTLEDPRSRFSRNDSKSNTSDVFATNWRNSLSKPRAEMPQMSRVSRQPYVGRFSDGNRSNMDRSSDNYNTWNSRRGSRTNVNSGEIWSRNGSRQASVNREERDSDSTTGTTPLVRRKPNTEFLKSLITGTDKPSGSRPNIFGNAKPVDTASKMEETTRKLDSLHLGSSATDNEEWLDGKPTYKFSRSEDFRDRGSRQFGDNDYSRSRDRESRRYDGNRQGPRKYDGDQRPSYRNDRPAYSDRRSSTRNQDVRIRNRDQGNRFDNRFPRSENEKYNDENSRYPRQDSSPRPKIGLHNRFQGLVSNTSEEGGED